MTGKTHLLFGVLCGIVASQAIPMDAGQQIAVIAACSIGSLAPDIDSPQSMINNFMPPLRLMTLFVSHRGIFHAIWIPLLLITSYWSNDAILYLSQIAGVQGFTIPDFILPVLWAIGIGWSSHIFLDALTPRGIPFFYPVGKSINLLPKIISIRTGGIVEFVFSLWVSVGIGTIILYLLDFI